MQTNEELGRPVGARKRLGCSSRCAARLTREAAGEPDRPRPRTKPALLRDPHSPPARRPPARPQARAREPPPAALLSTFFGLARLYAKHGLNKDSLVAKPPAVLVSARPADPPAPPPWPECTPMAVEQRCSPLASETSPRLLARAAHHRARPWPLAVRRARLGGGAGARAAPRRAEARTCSRPPRRPAGSSRTCAPSLPEHPGVGLATSSPRTIEQLLRDVRNALGPSREHGGGRCPPSCDEARVQRRAAADARRRAGAGCARVPHDRESVLWAMFRRRSRT